MSPWPRWSLLTIALAGCARPATLPSQREAVEPMSAEAAQEALARLRSAEPESFKMIHQVAARYQGRTHLMTGYLLGRKDGSFRVSAAAGIGPKLFDVAKVDGRWEARVHLPQLAERLDPSHLGRAVERIYFVDATGPLQAAPRGWVSRSPLTGDDDVDTVEVFRDGRTLAVVRKCFYKEGLPVLEIDYGKLEQVHAHWFARHVRLADRRGYELEVGVSEYQPGFSASDAQLRVTVPGRSHN